MAIALPQPPQILQDQFFSVNGYSEAIVQNEHIIDDIAAAGSCRVETRDPLHFSLLVVRRLDSLDRLSAGRIGSPSVRRCLLFHGMEFGRSRVGIVHGGDVVGRERGRRDVEMQRNTSTIGRSPLCVSAPPRLCALFFPGAHIRFPSLQPGEFQGPCREWEVDRLMARAS